MFFSMDWFKGKSTGNHRFSHEIWGFPVDFPLKIATLDPHGSMVRDPPISTGIHQRNVRNLLQGKGLQALLGAFDAWRNLWPFLADVRF